MNQRDVLPTCRWARGGPVDANPHAARRTWRVLTPDNIRVVNHGLRIARGLR
jgi:hypothetical protein